MGAVMSQYSALLVNYCMSEEKKVCFHDKTNLNEVAVSLLFPPAKSEKNFIFTFVSGIQFSKKSLL